MINQNMLSALAEQLEMALPDLQSLVMLTADGLALLSRRVIGDDDRLAALGALLYGAAEQLADQIDAEHLPKGVVIQLEPWVYVMTPINADYLLGLQLPAHHTHGHLMDKVNHLVQSASLRHPIAA